MTQMSQGQIMSPLPGGVIAEDEPGHHRRGAQVDCRPMRATTFFASSHRGVKGSDPSGQVGEYLTDVACETSGSLPCRRRVCDGRPKVERSKHAQPEADHCRGSVRGHSQDGGARRHRASARKPDPRLKVDVGTGGGCRQLVRGRTTRVLRLRAATATTAPVRLTCGSSM
jgi:hypothetical protein